MKPFAFQILYNYTLHTLSRYPGSTFMDHVIRYQDTPGIKMIVVLGEVGLIVVAPSGLILFWNMFVISFTLNKPDWRHWGVQDLPRYQRGQNNQAGGVLVHWNLCYDVCFRGFFCLNALLQMLFLKNSHSLKLWFRHPQVQFGHAGACANQASETAVAKNQALREAGAYVPKSFDELGHVIGWEINHESSEFSLWESFPPILCPIVKQDCLWATGGQWDHRPCWGGASTNSTDGLLLGQSKNTRLFSTNWQPS